MTLPADFLGHLLLSEVTLTLCSKLIGEIPTFFLSSLKGANLALPAANATQIEIPKWPQGMHSIHTCTVWTPQVTQTGATQPQISAAPQKVNWTTLLIQQGTNYFVFKKLRYLTFATSPGHFFFQYLRPPRQLTGQTQVERRGCFGHKWLWRYPLLQNTGRTFLVGGDGFAHPAEKSSTL